MKDPRFGSCDYVFLCAPVEINLECLAYLKEIRQPGCIITDVGSVKGIIHQKVDELGMTDCFIGGHPMAGSEKPVSTIPTSAFWKMHTIFLPLAGKWDWNIFQILQS